MKKRAVRSSKRSLSVNQWMHAVNPIQRYREVKVAKELAASLFNSLKAKGLLIKMDDDD
jgi:hypothetical protein